jgi:hypothetical protein
MTCSDIISSIGIAVEIFVAFLTLFTLKAAIQANKQNREEIIQAQKAIQTSIKIQEQSKNIELLNKRIAVIDKIEQYENPHFIIDLIPHVAFGIYDKVSENEIRILFRDDRGIDNDFKTICECISNAHMIEKQLKSFYHGFCQKDNIGQIINPVWEQILQYESLGGQEDSVDAKFIDYCNDHIYTDSESMETLNYFALKEAMNDNSKKFEAAKSSIIMKIRVFIDESIKPIES